MLGTMKPLLPPRVRALWSNCSRTVLLAWAAFALFLRLDAQPAAEWTASEGGDPWRGQQVFHDPATGGCIQCHAVAGFGGAVGPDLTRIGSRRSAAQLRAGILNPAAVHWRSGVKPQQGVELADGRRLEGVSVAAPREALVLVDARGRTNVVQRRDVRRRFDVPAVSMPTDYDQRLSPRQLADVVAYCASLTSDPRERVRRSRPPGFESLFNGKDLKGFKAVPSWRADRGVLRHEGVGEHLWHTRPLRDFELMLEWRWPDPPRFEAFPVIDAAGYEVKRADGAAVVERVLDAGDSGVLLRGLFKAQANLFCYPVGSGEFWEYREESKGEARRAFTPLIRADRPIGQWNSMWIRVVGNRVWVRVNGAEVIRNCPLPGVPAEGPVGFQHEHGGLELRNIWVREI